MTNDQEILRSPLSQEFTEDGMTVRVEIYKIEGGGGWTLELIDDKDGSTVWEETFATDTAAFDEFTEALRELGMAKLIDPSEGEVATVH